MSAQSHTLHAARSRAKPPVNSGKTHRRSAPAAGEHQDAGRMAETLAGARETARHAEISRDAYYRAERRGFTPGYELEDWLAAEAAVDAVATFASIDDPSGTATSHYSPGSEI